MQRVQYELTVNDWAVSSSDDPRTELIALDVRRVMNSPVGIGRVVVYVAAAAAPGLLEQAVGMAASAVGLGGAGGVEQTSVSVRGNAIAIGDPVEITLAAGETRAKVLTGIVGAVRVTLQTVEITAISRLHHLAQGRTNRVYENQSLRKIVQDLAGQYDMPTGDVATGSTYSYYVVHESQSVLAHLAELARRDMLDYYTDPDDSLVMQAFDKSSPDYTLDYGVHILDAAFADMPLPYGGARVYGESPASNQGDRAWHWLAKDLSSFVGEAGESDRQLAVSDGALRTQAATKSLAAALFGGAQDNALRGHVLVLGHPGVKLGDAVELAGVPRPELNGLYKVTSVRHTYSKNGGFVTRAGFSRFGSAQDAGLLGALGGLL